MRIFSGYAYSRPTCIQDRHLWIWISMDIHGKSVDMDIDIKFNIHGKPEVRLVKVTFMPAFDK